MFSPIADATGFATPCNALAAVARLFFRCCPSAVCRRVVAVVVDAIDAMLKVRSWPHVCKERLQRGFPSFTDRDPSAPVAVEHFYTRIPAPFLHRRPALIFGRRWAAVLCMAMFGDAVAAQTAARPMLIHSEVASANLRDDLAAIATALPRGLTAEQPVAFQDDKSGEPSTGNVDKGWHPVGIIMSSAIGSQENR